MQVRSHIPSSSIVRGIIAVCAAVLVTSAPSTALAAGVVGTGTAASCTDAALDAALAGGGLVTFNCGGPATIDISSGTGTKTIAADTTVDGGGLITISGGGTVPLFLVFEHTRRLAVHRVTLSGGQSDGDGGAITNWGILTVTDSIFSDNSALGGNVSSGGAIANEGGGILTVTNSTFSGNHSDVGGAIASFGSGTLTVTNSTFSRNHAGVGGAIFCNSSNGEGGPLAVIKSAFSDNSATASGGGAIANGAPEVGFPGGTLTVTNSTFSGNSAAGDGGDGHGGGAIVNGGSVDVTYSTFSGNSAKDGVGGAIQNGAICGDARNSPCPATLRNTIVANSTQGGNCAGTITDGGHNLDSDGTCGVGPATDPLLDPAGLANNGGPTQTIALQAGSLAIDAGDPEVCGNPSVNGVDQRGYSRPGIGHTQCSIGAYEADAVPPEASCTGDCDGNGVVAINELILGVNIGLDMRPVDACPAFATPEGMVDIAQLIKGVNNALDGCGVG